jgi:hypothetical protein
MIAFGLHNNHDRYAGELLRSPPMPAPSCTASWHYPEWSLTRDLESILGEIHDANAERWSGALI